MRTSFFFIASSRTIKFSGFSGAAFATMGVSVRLSTWIGESICVRSLSAGVAGGDGAFGGGVFEGALEKPPSFAEARLPRVKTERTQNRPVAWRMKPPLAGTRQRHGRSLDVA